MFIVCLTKKLHVQSDSTHEQIDVAQALASHISRESLAVTNGLHNAIPVEY